MIVKQNKLIKLFNRFSYLVEKIVNILAIISMGSLAIVMILNVSFRYFLNLPIIWADEAVLFLFAWVTFLGASMGVQRNNMAAVRIFVDRFSGKTLKCFNIAIQILVLFFGVLIMYFGFKWWLSPSTINAISPSLGFPMWIPTLMLPFGMLFIVIFTIMNIIRIYNNEELKTEEY